MAFGVATALFSVPVTTALLRQVLFAGAAGLVLGAWFWWPWYVGDALAAWPRHGVRVATASGNRWDRLFLSWRMQRMATSGRLRWRGFVATGLVIGIVVLASAMGAYKLAGPRRRGICVLRAAGVARWFGRGDAGALRAVVERVGRMIDRADVGTTWCPCCRVVVGNAG